MAAAGVMVMQQRGHLAKYSISNNYLFIYFSLSLYYYEGPNQQEKIPPSNKSVIGTSDIWCCLPTCSSIAY